MRCSLLESHSFSFELPRGIRPFGQVAAVAQVPRVNSVGALVRRAVKDKCSYRGTAIGRWVRCIPIEGLRLVGG
eukprot:1182519-Prorocentrum_minimum.AAC.1